MKKAEGVLRRLVKKYSVKLNVIEVRILLGRSQIMDAMASANG